MHRRHAQEAMSWSRNTLPLQQSSLARPIAILVDEPMISVMATCSRTARIGSSRSLGSARIAAHPPRICIADIAYLWTSLQSVLAPNTCVPNQHFER